MSAVASMMALTGSVSGGVGPTTERYFALWGAGGGGGGMDTGGDEWGAAAGNGAFMEIKVEGIPSGMVFNMVCGDGGTAGNRASSGGGGGGGGSASILRCEYNGANALLAVAGAGGGGGGGGGSPTSSGRAPSTGAGGSSTSTKQANALDVTYGNIRGGHTAGISSSPTMSNHGTYYDRLDPLTRETYAQDGGLGGRAVGGGMSATSPIGDGVGTGGSLPTASWGGQGGTGGAGASSEGGAGGGGGGYYGGCGGQGGTAGGNSGGGGGGGSSYVSSGSVSVGGATLTVTLLQESRGSHKNSQVSTPNVSNNSVANPSVTLEYGVTGFTNAGRGGNGGRNTSGGGVLDTPQNGTAGRIQIHSDTALIDGTTNGGSQLNVTVTI